MKIVIAAHTQAGGDFVVGSHHLARELALRGHDVIHLSSAITPLHLTRMLNPTVRRRVRTAMRRPRLNVTGATHVVPFRSLPDARRRSASGDSGRLQRWWLRHLHLGSTEVVLIDQPALAWILACMANALVVYRPTDIYADLSGNKRIQAFESFVLQRSDGAIATSVVVLDHVRQIVGDSIPTALIENGVEYSHLRTAASTADRCGRTVAVYVGALDERFDWDALDQAARELTSIDFAIYGPTTRHPPLPCNVTLCGPVNYAELPDALAGAAVGLLPLSDHPGNAGRSPMKFYEYRAAGLPVVARSTPELERRSGDWVFLYEHPGDLATAIRTAVDSNPDRAAISESARSFDWSERAQQVEEFITSLTVRR